MATYADQLFATLDGVSFEVKSVRKSGSFKQREPVKTMNPTGRPLGTRSKVGDVSIELEIPVRAGLPDFDNVEASVLILRQRVTGPPNYTAIGVFSKGESDVGADAESGDQMLKVSLGCLDWREGA